MYEYKAELKRVIDGDTLRLKLFKDIDIGFRVIQTISVEMNFRLVGIDTPEVRGIEKEAGLMAKDYVKELLSKSESMRAVTYKSDSFGRWLADIYIVVDGEEIWLNKHLLDEGYAEIYKK